MIRRSKTDQFGEGMIKGLPYFTNKTYCPVTNLKNWIKISKIKSGPIFRRFIKGSALSKNRLTDQSVVLIIKDYLKLAGIENNNFSVIGNFPYNISSQIVFKIIENRKLIPEMCGMFQYEVAERICENEGSKKYGIISVITQAFYETKLLFEVSNNFFSPPPKVNSAVILLKRKKNLKIDCDEKLFFKIVKLSFQQRRKTLRNSLKQINLSDNLREHIIFDKRPEQLSVDQFVDLTNLINQDLKLSWKNP